MKTNIDLNTGNAGVLNQHDLLPPSLQKNDKKAGWLIGIFSFVVFAVVVSLGKLKMSVDLGFNPHVFAKINAVINSLVAILLLSGLLAVKQGKYLLHKRIMTTALILSILFLVSYICHHLFTGDTKYLGQGMSRYIYYVILITHIFLAAIILPFYPFYGLQSTDSRMAKTYQNGPYNLAHMVLCVSYRGSGLPDDQPVL